MINLYPSEKNVIKTKRQFFGMLCGDFTKTAVRTALPCGAIIGPAATDQNLLTSMLAAENKNIKIYNCA